MTTWRINAFIRFIILMLAFVSGFWQTLAAQDGDFLPPEAAFQYAVVTDDDGKLTVTWTIAPDYYLYRKRLSMTADNGEVLDIAYPQGKLIHDEYFGDSEVYYQQVSLTTTVKEATAIHLRWQGCAEAGLCYPPQTATYLLQQSALPDAFAGGDNLNRLLTLKSAASPLSSNKPTTQQTTALPITAETPTGATSLAQDQQLASDLGSRSIGLNLAVFFGLGVLLAFTPCVLPMIPILSAVVVGSQATRRRAFSLSVAFVLAMALTYALIGVLAALAGASLQAMLQRPLFIVPLVVIFVLLALSMFGLYELQLPAFIRNRLNKASNQQKGGSLSGAAVMGFFSALLASPCMTAPLAGALIYIADTGNVSLGGLALLALGLGMGAPLIIIATLGSVLLPKPGRWMEMVKAAFGFILLATAIWFVGRIVTPTLLLALWGGFVFALAVALWQIKQVISPTNAMVQLLRTLAILMATWAGLMLIGAAGGSSSITQPLAVFVGQSAPARHEDSATFIDIKTVADLQQQLQQAQASGQWVLLDFYADWCVSCQVIEKEVFADKKVQQVLQTMRLLRADVTDYDSQDKALMNHLSVIAPPSILLFNPQGKEARANRTVGELSAQAFLERLTPVTTKE